jgi:hypothetical protein
LQPLYEQQKRHSASARIVKLLLGVGLRIPEENKELTVSSKRKMLAAREDLVDRINKIADKNGLTLFGLTNSLLESSIDMDNMGGSLREAVDNYATIKAVRDASFTLVLESLLYDTVDLAFQQAKEKASTIWYEAGVWMARQYAMRGTDDPIILIGKDVKAFSWNAPEFRIEKHQKEISIRVLSPRFSESYTVLFTCFLEGILETLNYEIKFKEIGRGNIRLEAVVRGANVKR